MRQCPTTGSDLSDHSLQGNARLEGKQGLEMQARSSSGGTQQHLLVREIRKPAQELPQVLVKTGPPPPFGVPTLCHLLVPFPLSLPPSPKIASPVQAKFWLLRAPSPQAAILQASQYQEQSCSTHFGEICMPAFPDHVLPYSGTGRWGAGRYGELGGMGMGTPALEKKGSSGDTGAKPTHITTTRQPHAGTEHMQWSTTLSH